MARLFVFGIGGTGARVLKSLTMLLASGIKAGDFEIIPILVDPHESLDELNNCNKLLKLYGDINKDLYRNVTGVNEGFFYTPLSTLASIAPGTGIKDGFSMDGNYGITFGQFLERNNFPKGNKTNDFLSLLYSQSDNFNKSLSVGFKGNPNVGCIVLNKLKETQFYKAFTTAFGGDDRVFIISSIFGGTGAAGFPLLLKNLRQNPDMKLRDAQIGALTVMPYFKLSDPEGDPAVKSDIDSKNFITKTKAALTYYINNIKDANALYYIADPDKATKPYKNNELEQKNAAHLAEMLGALSIIHFAKNDFQPKQQEIYEYGLKKDEDSIHFRNIGDETTTEIGLNLTSIFLLNKVHKVIKEKPRLPFRITSDFDGRFFNDPFFSNKLEEFLDEYFEKWLEELSENQRAFRPFNLLNKGSFANSVTAYQVHGKFLPGLVSRPFDASDIFARMARRESKYKYLNKVNKKCQYLSLTYNALKKSIIENVQFINSENYEQ